MAVYYLVGPIRSGKTTKLKNWIENRNDIGGILSPDINGMRMMYDISAKNYFTFECREDQEGEKIMVGRFNFLKATFDEANNILSKSFKENQFTILDEWGKLEVNEKGFMPEVDKIIREALVAKDRHIIIVVRDTILDLFLDKFPEAREIDLD